MYAMLILIMVVWELELQSINRRSCTITEEAPTRAFSWLKVPTSAHLAQCCNSVLNVGAFNQEKALS